MMKVQVGAKVKRQLLKFMQSATFNKIISSSKGNYEKAIDLKKLNPKLKILLAVGGLTYLFETFIQARMFEFLQK
jgi:hypothetical protein